MRGYNHSANQVISQWSTFNEALTFVRRWEDKLEPHARCWSFKSVASSPESSIFHHVKAWLQSINGL